MADYQFMGRAELRDKNAAARDFIDSMYASSNNPDTFNAYALDKITRRPDFLDNEILRDRLREILGAKAYADIAEFVARKLSLNREKLKAAAPSAHAVQWRGRDIAYLNEQEIDTAIREVMAYVNENQGIADTAALPDYIFGKNNSGGRTDYFVLGNSAIDRMTKVIVLTHLINACVSPRSGLLQHVTAGLSAPPVCVDKRDISALYKAITAGVYTPDAAGEIYRLAVGGRHGYASFESWLEWRHAKQRALTKRGRLITQVLLARASFWLSLAKENPAAAHVCKISAPPEYTDVMRYNGLEFIVCPTRIQGMDLLRPYFPVSGGYKAPYSALGDDLYIDAKLARYVRTLSAAELKAERRRFKPRRVLDLGE